MDLARALYERGMIKFGRFKLTSGRESTIYVDLRPLPSYPDVFKEVVELLTSKVKEEVVCGIAVGGLPLATAVAYRLSIPLIYVRKERKEHGTKSLLEGYVKPGTRVLVMDDVATTGGSLLRAVEEVRELGGIVERALVVVDRRQGADEALQRYGIRLESLTTLPEIVERLLPSLPPEEVELASSYLREVVG